MIIDETYFIQDVYLPLTAKTLPAFQATIEKKEPVILKKLMGVELYDLMIADLAGGLPQAQRFIDLIDGKKYRENDILIEWVGLRSKYYNLIANYVYYEYRIIKETYTMTVSEVKGKTENSKTVSGYDKIIDSWRAMYDLYYSAYQFLNENKSEYPEWVFCPIEQKTRLI